MQQSKRRVTTVKLSPKIAKAMKARAARNDKTISDVVNDALAEQLRQEQEIIRIARQRMNEEGPGIPLAEVLREAGLSDLLRG
jgi:predicted transcriptional regulator